jgi:hypothetical protein
LNTSWKRLSKFSLACQEEMIGNFSTKLVLSCVRNRNGLDSLVGTGTSPRQKANLYTKYKFFLYVYVYRERKYIRQHKPPFYMLVSPKISKTLKKFGLLFFLLFLFFLFFGSTWWIMNFYTIHQDSHETFKILFFWIFKNFNFHQIWQEGKGSGDE